jgi:hypothetical protein
VIDAVRVDGDASAVLSTVDTAQTPAGRSATVLALAEQASGGVGQYGGVGDVDGPFPPQR